MVDRFSGRFEPLHSAHAIEQVAITIQVARPMDDAQLNVVDRAFQGDSSLPSRSEMRTMVMAFGVNPALPTGGLGGYLFQRTRSDGSVEAEVRIDRNSVTFRTFLYTRWAQVWGQARSYFEKVFPVNLQSTTLAAIGLMYVDKFIWGGEPQQARASALLKPDSPYVASHIFKYDDFWHSHTGAFIRADSRTKRLMNVNVDFLDDPGARGPAVRTISITTVLNDMFNQPGYDNLGVVSDPLGFVESHLEELHRLDKSIIGAMLTDDMSKRIALES